MQTIKKVRNDQRALKSGRYYLGFHDDLKRLERFTFRMEELCDNDGWPLFDDVEHITVPGGIEVYGVKL